MPVPPEAVMVTGVMATPCTALIVTQVAVGGGLTIMEQPWVVVPAALFRESTTVAVKLIVPGLGGIPLNAPVVGVRINQAGSPIAEKVYGENPPDAVKLEEYKTPTCPVLAPQVNVGAGAAANPKSMVSSVLLSVGSVTIAGLPLLSVAGLPPWKLGEGVKPERAGWVESTTTL